MSNRRGFQEAFPGNESDPGPDYCTLVLGVVLVLIVIVAVVARCMPL